MDSTLNIVEAHAIAQRVHDCIEERFEEVRHIVIHVNPYTQEENQENREVFDSGEVEESKELKDSEEALN